MGWEGSHLPTELQSLRFMTGDRQRQAPREGALPSISIFISLSIGRHTCVCACCAVCYYTHVPGLLCARTTHWEEGRVCRSWINPLWSQESQVGKSLTSGPAPKPPSASSDDGQCPCYQLYCLISVSHSTLTCSLKGCDIIYSGTSHRKKYSYRRKKISFDVRHWRIEIFTFLLAFYIHPKRNHSPECHSVSLLCGNSNYPHLGEVLLGDCKEQYS